MTWPWAPSVRRGAPAVTRQSTVLTLPHDLKTGQKSAWLPATSASRWNPTPPSGLSNAGYPVERAPPPEGSRAKIPTRLRYASLRCRIQMAAARADSRLRSDAAARPPPPPPDAAAGTTIWGGERQRDLFAGTDHSGGIQTDSGMSSSSAVELVTKSQFRSIVPVEGGDDPIRPAAADRYAAEVRPMRSTISVATASGLR